MIIDGRKIAERVERQARERVERLREVGVKPKLVVLSTTSAEGAKIYEGVRRRACDRVGIICERIDLTGASEEDVIGEVEALNQDESVHGILLEAPWSPDIDPRRVFMAMDPLKDVEGLSPCNLGALIAGREDIAPCTPRAVIEIAQSIGFEFEGADVVVVNHSMVVGKPLSIMLLNRNATVHVCHVYTKNIVDSTKKSDMLIVAAGVPGLIGREHVKEGAVVIDVGMNRVNGRVVGDARFDELLDYVKAITPVPGGVGPVTTAYLMLNTVICAERVSSMRGII